MKETKAEIMAEVGDAGKSRVIGNNTVEYWDREGSRVVRFHHTDVVTFKEGGDIILNSGGWKTPTTKERINAHLPAPWGVYQENSIWYLTQGKFWNDPDRKVYPFQDGITIHPDGAVSGEGEDPKKTLKLKKRVKEYVKGYMEELTARKLPKPSGGGCWMCLLKGFGDNGEHLISHMKEKYYVPSLLVRAVEEIPVSPFAKSSIGYWLHYHDQDPGQFGSDFVPKQVARSLTRYMYRHLGLAA